MHRATASRCGLVCRQFAICHGRALHTNCKPSSRGLQDPHSLCNRARPLSAADVPYLRNLQHLPDQHWHLCPGLQRHGVHRRYLQWLGHLRQGELGCAGLGLNGYDAMKRATPIFGYSRPRKSHAHLLMSNPVVFTWLAAVLHRRGVPRLVSTRFVRSSECCDVLGMHACISGVACSSATAGDSADCSLPCPLQLQVQHHKRSLQHQGRKEHGLQHRQVQCQRHLPARR